MTTPTYIHNLLYRYDCVIVPGFGGFITNAVSAKVNPFSNTFYPPTKQITFNAHLTNNDGLLANCIASSEGISFEQACKKIEGTVNTWNAALQDDALVIDKVGRLSLNKEQQITFDPEISSNYLMATFGMSPVSSPAIKRIAYKKQVEQLAPIAAQTKTSSFIKYAAAVALIFSTGIVGWNVHQSNQLEAQYAEQQVAIEKKIQSATFVIENPLPTIQLNVAKDAPKHFHIVAGAFEFRENAEKKLKQLKAKGFNAAIIGKNKWGLTQVSYSSHETRAEAYKKLAKIKYHVSEDAWLLIKKLQ